MDEVNKDTPELDAVPEVKEEEIRAKVIEEFGFDEIDDAERIDKLVKKDMDGRKKLSDAIGQKIKYRSEAEELRKTTPKPTPEPAKQATVDARKLLAEEFEKRDLEALDYPDDLKKEIQRIAQVQGVSIKQAARDPYIAYKVSDWEKEQKADEASISRTNRSSSKKTYSIDNPPDVDMATAEGRKEWDDYVQAMKKAGN